MSGNHVELAGRDALAIVEDLDVIDGVIAGRQGAEVGVGANGSVDAEDDLFDRNLFGEGDRIAARASSASTRRQYAAIYRRFAHWLRGELGRPPVLRRS